MNYLIKCPDCQSDKLAMQNYERLAILCVNCGLVFNPQLANVSSSPSGNLKRLMFMFNQFSTPAAVALYRDLTGGSKSEAKELLKGLTLEDIKTHKP